MKRDELVSLARECQMPQLYQIGDDIELTRLERFAALVAEAEREQILQKNAPVIASINAHMAALKQAVVDEREACAAVCTEHVIRPHLQYLDFKTWQECAAAIRARGQQ